MPKKARMLPVFLSCILLLFLLLLRGKIYHPMLSYTKKMGVKVAENMQFTGFFVLFSKFGKVRLSSINFSLALVQDDIETFYWGGTSAFGDVWGQLYRDSGYNADVVWQTLKNDLSIYNAFGSSDYADFWIAGEALYDQYESGELERNLPTDQYKMLIDKLNKITKRLGIFYSSREIADSFSN